MENQRVILLRDQRHEFDKRSHILRKCSSASEHESFVSLLWPVVTGGSDAERWVLLRHEPFKCQPHPSET